MLGITVKVNYKLKHVDDGTKSYLYSPAIIIGTTFLLGHSNEII